MCDLLVCDVAVGVYCGCDVALFCFGSCSFVSSGCLVFWLHFNGVILVVSVLVWVVLFVFWIGRGGIVC